MIKTRKLLSAFVALTLGIGMVACAGDDGDTGPAGPAGNANVKATTQTLSASDWTSVSATHFKASVSVPNITQAVVSNGIVVVSLKPNGSNTYFENEDWTTLPHTVIRYVSNTAIGISYDFTYDVGKIDLVNRSGYAFANYEPGEFSFKAVVIPSSAIQAGVDVNNYEEVKEVYGIQEFDLEL